jgi:phosphopantothenate---cysteine ligase (CTP)
VFKTHFGIAMKIIITCGPSYEPIDGARRMGKLGMTLANHLTDEGHEVICLRGEGSTYAGELRAETVLPFSTNDDLAEQLEHLSQAEDGDALFHAAALCDYRVEQVLSAAGEAIVSKKFATRDGRLHMVLAPATKVLPKLRAWFPRAHIVGWKYELAGTSDDAFAKAWNQLRTCGTDACVLNGAAYGSGFAVCRRGGEVPTCDNSSDLFTVLSEGLFQGRKDLRRVATVSAC